MQEAGSVHPFTATPFMMDRESEDQPGRRVENEGQWLESNSSESLGKQDQRWPTADWAGFGAVWARREKGAV